MQRNLQVRAVLEVGEGVHKRVLDPEEFHDEEIAAGSPVSTGSGLSGGSVAGCRAGSSVSTGSWLSGGSVGWSVGEDLACGT